MKYWYLLLCFLVFNTSLAQVKWLSIDEAFELQQKQPKKIFINFFSQHLGVCKEMDKKVLEHPIISEYINKYFYPVKFDVEEKKSIKYMGKTFSSAEKGKPHSFTKFMNVSSIPSIIFIDEKNTPITILNGVLKAKELEPYLSLISTDKYLKINSPSEWSEYQRKFKSKIKE